jgi:hypothetical protein
MIGRQALLAMAAVDPEQTLAVFKMADLSFRAEPKIFLCYQQEIAVCRHPADRAYAASS